MKKTGRGILQKRRKQRLKRIIELYQDRAWRERVAWLERPRLHTAIFADALRDEEMGSTDLPEAQKERQKKRKEEIEAIAKKLGWSHKRLTLFKKTVTNYRREPTAKNYLSVRHIFPEIEIQIARFAGLDPLFALEGDFKKNGIDSQLIAAVLDAHEPSIDKLSLLLLQLLVERENLPKEGPGHIQRRRNAISDAMVNYLIIVILESFDWHEEISRVPASLIELIRHQLCGTSPDLHAEYLAKQKRQDIASAMGQILEASEKLSVGKLAKMANIPRTTAARWLKQEDFNTLVSSARTLKSGSWPKPD